MNKNRGASVLTSPAVHVWVANKAVSTLALESVINTLADGIETTGVGTAYTDTGSLSAGFVCFTVWIFVALWLYT